MPTKKRENRTFRNGEDGLLNCCVGNNGGPYDASDYACGFFEAAKSLICKALDDRFHMDVLIYPITYNFRQGIELSIKHLLRILPPLWDEHSEVRYTHRLYDNWANVKAYLKRSEAMGVDDASMERMEGIVADLIDVDPTGEAFRYPANKAGARYLSQWTVINLQPILDSIEWSENFFEACEYQAEVLWESKGEAIYE